MNTLTNISQRTLRSFQGNAEVYRRRYDPVESAVWHLEDKRIPAFVVPVSHSIIRYGDVYDLYGRMNAAELYGTLRNHVIEYVLLTQTSPVKGCVCAWITETTRIEDAYSENWHFVIEWPELHRFLNHFLRDTLQKNETNWMKEGF